MSRDILVLVHVGKSNLTRENRVHKARSREGRQLIYPKRCLNEPMS